MDTIGFGWHLMITAGVSTVCWVVVALLTAPTDEKKLVEFYELVRPGSPWWKPIAKRSSVVVDRIVWHDVIEWCAGVVFIYAALFAVGKLLLHGGVAALPYLAVALLAGAIVWRSVARSWAVSG